MSPALLEVRNLSVRFDTPDGTAHAVRDVSFSIAPGEVLGVVGESGSGKSITMLSLLGLTAGGAIGGSATFRGRDLLTLTQDELRGVRGREVGVVFQDSLTSLHPMFTVGWQLAQAVRAHQPMTRSQARVRATELLHMVRIDRPGTRLDEYPHEFSGGMRQRVLIAMALANRPALLIADEPTTALDSTTQAEIIALLRDLQAELGMALVLITHDVGVVADLADRVMVMYAGRLVESGPASEVLATSRHPYTRALLASIPQPGSDVGIQAIPGQPPSPLAHWSGCSFASRCRLSIERCEAESPPLRAVEASPRHTSACWISDVLTVPPPTPATSGVRARQPERAPRTALLRATGIVKRFGATTAVAGVDLSLAPGTTLGLVGESGSGKSTLARCLGRLLDPDEGTITYDGHDVTHLSGRELREMRREVQFVFQDPYSSLNPRRRVGSIIAEPLRVHGVGNGTQRRQRVNELMELVGLSPDAYNKFPANFSGGQRQRIGIARALALDPRVLICDEPVSALDVSIQAQIITLLADLQRQLSLACLFISHDLGVVEHVSSTTAVMYRGRIIESAPSRHLAAHPEHPYTAALLANAPGNRLSHAQLSHARLARLHRETR